VRAPERFGGAGSSPAPAAICFALDPALLGEHHGVGSGRYVLDGSLQECVRPAVGITGASTPDWDPNDGSDQ
jgi:hypothetical protein